MQSFIDIHKRVIKTRSKSNFFKKKDSENLENLGIFNKFIKKKSIF